MAAWALTLTVELILDFSRQYVSCNALGFRDTPSSFSLDWLGSSYYISSSELLCWLLIVSLPSIIMPVPVVDGLSAWIGAVW